MNAILEQLEAEGCEIQAALGRTLNDEDFLLDCMKMVIDDQGFAALGAALDSGDVKAGFEAAHSLKGICANTGLEPLTTIVSGMTEVLRAGGMDGLQPQYEQLMAAHAHVKEVLGA